MTEEEYQSRKRQIKIKIMENLTSAKNWLAFLSFAVSAYVAFTAQSWEGVAIFLAGQILPATQIVSKTKQNIEFKRGNEGE